MTDNNIAIIIVNYQGSADTVSCLESLVGLVGVRWAAFVVDNASGDGSVEHISSFLDRSDVVSGSGVPRWCRVKSARALPDNQNCRVYLIESEMNLGFSGGNNLGIRVAKEVGGYTHYWLLNNDTNVDPHSASEAMKAFGSDRSVGLVGGTVFNYSDRSVVQSIGVNYNLITTQSRQIGSGYSFDEMLRLGVCFKDVTYIPGCSLFISSDALGCVYPMREDYFLYFEEMDIHQSIRKKYSTAWAPMCWVYHREGGSAGSSSSGRGSDLSIYYMNRNVLLFYWINFPILIFVAIARVLFNYLRFSLSGDVQATSNIAVAVKHFLGGVRGGPTHPSSKLARQVMGTC